MRLCRLIGTELLAVEYDDKDTCIAKLAKSNIIYHLSQFIYFSPQTSQNNAVNIMIKITSMEKKGIQN
jgi:hypothetical protein